MTHAPDAIYVPARPATRFAGAGGGVVLAAAAHAAVAAGLWLAQTYVPARPLPPAETVIYVNLAAPAAPVIAEPPPVAKPTKAPRETEPNPAIEPETAADAKPVVERAAVSDPTPEPEPMAGPTHDPEPKITAAPPKPSAPTRPRPVAVSADDVQDPARSVALPVSAPSPQPAPRMTALRATSVGTPFENDADATTALYAHNPEPPYPAAARRRGQQGRVVVRVAVTEAGGVRHVALFRSSGFRLLDAAAVDAVRRWTFIPATLNGSPVASTVDVPIRFGLK